jgi:hypothetical protein
MTSTVAIFTFDTTHFAFWAEEVAGEKGIPVETAPAPAEANAKCGISLRTPLSRGDDLAAAFSAEGIEFGRMEG